MNAPENYTAAQIKNMCLTWFNFNGFSGETCGKCGATANVLGMGAGWFCGCGSYNCQHFFCNNATHALPIYGPSHKTIQEGYEQAKGEVKHDNP